MANQNSFRFAFADFIFDTETGELTQDGIRVRINQQIADLLLVLIQNAGQLVSREEIKNALWPDRELLNHEKVITNGISRLRFILKDDPARPRFIESLPKRGYRFIEGVRQLPDQVPTPPLALSKSLKAAHELESEPKALLVLDTTKAITEPSDLTTRDKEVPYPPDSMAGNGHVWIGTIALVLVLASIAAAVSYRFFNTASNIQSEPTSLGIAPFDATGPGSDELAGSFRLDLTDALAQLPKVQVRAAHSLELLKLNPTTFRGEAPKLGLDAILFGRLAVEGDQCNLQFELVRGKDGTHLASFRYSGTRNQLGSILNQVQMDIFARLRTAASGTQPPPGGQPGGTTDPEAYELYLRARYHFSQQTADSLQQALKEYKAAIQQDPNFAKAYAGEANTYIFLWQHDVLTQSESFRLAALAVQKALALDPSSADGHAVLGVIHFIHDWNLPEGENELQQALWLDPNQPVIHQWLALILCDEGRFQEAYREIDKAHAEDPLWISAFITEAHIASDGHDHARMVETSRRLMELMPESAHVRDAIANVDWADGHYVEAIGNWRTLALLENDSARVQLEDAGLQAFREGGVHAYAQVRLKAIQESKGSEKHPNDFDLPEWYAIAGENKKAIGAIRKGIASHDPEILQLAVLPAFDNLHSDPAFLSILHDMHLTLPGQDMPR